MNISTNLFKELDEDLWVEVVMRYSPGEDGSRHCAPVWESWELISATDTDGNKFPMDDNEIQDAINQIKDEAEDNSIS